MNYCIRYNNKSQKLNEAAEISIKYDGQDITLLEFMEANYLSRIILRVDDINDFIVNKEWKKLNAIKKKFPHYNFAVCFCARQSGSRDFMKDIEELNCDWFTDYPIIDWDTLHFWAAVGVSDVYICEALGFELDRVAKFCHARKIKVRIYPNVAQHSIKILQPLRSFFVRPEDVDFYEPYVDVMEFWCDLEKQDVYFHIYKEQKHWPGDLSHIIIGLESVNNVLIKDNFAATRVSCAKDCLRGESCDLCGHVATLSRLVKESQLTF